MNDKIVAVFFFLISTVFFPYNIYAVGSGGMTNQVVDAKALGMGYPYKKLTVDLAYQGLFLIPQKY